jgi:hypothetical protein
METDPFKPELVAPCGMNCGICKLYLAFSRGLPKEKGKVSHCNGCLIRAKNCYIKRGCKKLRTKQVKYCYECAEMPCKNLEHLERRYQERYTTSLVGNLKEVKEKGMEQFLQNQENSFKCSNCRDVVSVHNRECYTCKKKTPLQP